MAEKDPLVLLLYLPQKVPIYLKQLMQRLIATNLKMKSMGDVMGEQQLLPEERLKKVS